MSTRAAFAGLAGLALVACGGATASSDHDVRPFHPTCEEACHGGCEGDAETCQTRCASECAPAPSDEARVLAFVDAVRGSTDGTLPASIDADVAYRVRFAGVMASALQNVGPDEQPMLLAASEAERARLDDAEVRRQHVQEWQEQIGPRPCTATPGTLASSPFEIAPSIVAEVRDRLEPELARAATWRAAIAVECGDRSFHVVLLNDAPAIVPLL